MERNHLCNFGRGLHEDQFCEIVLNLDLWLSRRCQLKTFLIYIEIWWPLCSVERNHLCNFGRRHYMEYFEFEPVVQEMLFKDISYLELWHPF